MKHTLKVTILAVALFVAAACAPKNADTEIQAFYAALQTCAMTVEIAADYGDRVSRYTVDYRQTAPGEASITVEQPAEIAGMTAHIKNGSSELSYDGLILETGSLAGTALTPIDAVPTMMAAWAGGYACGFATAQYDGVKCVQLTFSTVAGESVVEQTAWFNAGNYIPVHAETSVDGKTVITCDFIGVEWQP